MSSLFCQASPLPVQDWVHASQVLLIDAAEAHLWRAALDRNDLGEARALLDSTEIARANRFRLPAHQERFALCRGILRSILGGYLGISGADVRLGASSAGKPILAGGDPDLHFNLSHSDEWLTVVCCRGDAVGVDIEDVRKPTSISQIAARYFTPGEQADLENAPEAERARRFFQMWTVREAILKADGVGLAGLQNVLPISAGWSVFQFSPAEFCVGAVALHPAVHLTGCFQFSAAS